MHLSLNNIKLIGRNLPTVRCLQTFMKDESFPSLNFLADFPALRILSIQQFQLSGNNILHEENVLTKIDLEEFFVAYTTFSIPFALFTDKLRRLEMHGSKIPFGDEDLQIIFKNLKHLREVFLPDCKDITDAGLNGTYKLSHLTGLRILQLNCTNVTDESYVSVFKLPELWQLGLSGATNITDLGVEGIVQGCPVLELFKFYECGITDSSVKVIAQKLKRLRMFLVESCKELTSASMNHLKEHCRTIQHIGREECNFDVDESFFSDIPTLKSII